MMMTMIMMSVFSLYGCMYVCIFLCVKFEKMMMIMIWMCGGGGGVLSRRIGTHSPLALLKTSRHNILYCYCTILDFYLFRFVVSSRYSIIVYNIQSGHDDMMIMIIIILVIFLFILLHREKDYIFISFHIKSIYLPTATLPHTHFMHILHCIFIQKNINLKLKLSKVL